MANGENNIPDVPNESNNSAGQNVEQMLSKVGQVNNKTELDINDYLPVLPTDRDWETSGILFSPLAIY